MDTGLILYTLGGCGIIFSKEGVGKWNTSYIKMHTKVVPLEWVRLQISFYQLYIKSLTTGKRINMDEWLIIYCISCNSLGSVWGYFLHKDKYAVLSATGIGRSTNIFLPNCTVNY